MRFSSLKNGWLVFVVIAALSSCYYDKKEILYPADNSCDTSGNTFSQKVKPILDKKCASCHGAGVYQSLGGAINLDGYTNASNYSSPNGSLLKTITGDPSVPLMPPSGKLTDCEISQIRKWVNEGAVNN
jgi:hypothetical protein